MKALLSLLPVAVFVMTVYASFALCTCVAGCAAVYAARRETNGSWEHGEVKCEYSIGTQIAQC